ncbi:MAG TPA: ammonium transporter [Xanthomonadales bacterium]|nr:ammonium transporter [Xanthomonadales bacterium]
MRRLACLLLSLPATALAATTAPDSGDTAWMLVATALVLLMTVPGLALFYAGMVRAKNVLSVMMQCFAIVALVTVLWFAYGYSFAFVPGHGALAGVIGGGDKLFFASVGRDALVGTIPETVFATYQLTFAAITPALIVGAFAERMRFGALLVFVAAWFTLAYLPVAHMVWGGAGSLLGDFGVLDFAGGTVVHVNAGIAGLVASIVIGRRRGFPNVPMPPHNLTFTLTGASLLWVGWFGFNAGSALAANATAGMAMFTTQLATAGAALAWMAAEWALHRKPSVLGIASGAVAGLVAITPAAGTCGPGGALAIGAISGVACFFAATRLKRRFGYDDALDVFGVHAVGGLVGALLTGVFAAEALGGTGLPAGGIAAQLGRQAAACGITMALSGSVSFVLLKLIDRFAGLRVGHDEEHEGLDLVLHNERGYIL